MNWEPIKCYLCDKDAEKLFMLGNLRVRPRYESKTPCECGFYCLTSPALHSRMDKQKKILISKQGIPLTKNQKWNLIDFVKKNQDPTGKEPAKIYKITFDVFTQKMLKPA